MTGEELKEIFLNNPDHRALKRVVNAKKLLVYQFWKETDSKDDESILEYCINTMQNDNKTIRKRKRSISSDPEDVSDSLRELSILANLNRLEHVNRDLYLRLTLSLTNLIIKLEHKEKEKARLKKIIIFGMIAGAAVLTFLVTCSVIKRKRVKHTTD